MQFLGPRFQGKYIFWDFIILLDWSHDSWKSEVLFVKIGARVLALWLDTSSEPKRGYFNQNFSNKFISPKYFAVAVSRSELKPTWTFTVMHEKFSPWSNMVLE